MFKDFVPYFKHCCSHFSSKEKKNAPQKQTQHDASQEPPVPTQESQVELKSIAQPGVDGSEVTAESVLPTSSVISVPPTQESQVEHKTTPAAQALQNVTPPTNTEGKSVAAVNSSSGTDQNQPNLVLDPGSSTSSAIRNTEGKSIAAVNSISGTDQNEPNLVRPFPLRTPVDRRSKR